MMDYNSAKIRIPNETFCPAKKIQFNTMFNNNLVNASTTINSSNFNNIASLKTNISQNNNIIPNTKVNPNQNLNPNIFSQQDNSSEEGVTISPIKSIVTAASSKPPTIIEPQCKLQKFLPPKTSKFHKTLVLDLDETLIHSYFDCCSPRPPDLSYDIIIEKRKIHVNSIVRPGAGEFLENVSSIFEVVIFTASLSEYANPLLDFIDKNKKCKYRLYREHCCSLSNGFTNSFTKDLKKLDRDMKNLIIIDNNPKSYILNKDNGVPIKTWVEDINDRELLRLIPYLIFLSSEKIEDVRPFLRQVNSGNILNYDKFDEIINKYNSENLKSKKDDSVNNNLTNSNNNNNLNNNGIIKENKKINGNDNNNHDNSKDIKKLNGNFNSENNINKKINTDEQNIKENNNKIIEIPNNNIIPKENKKSNEKINKNVENKNKKENNNNNKVETANKMIDNKKNINNKNKPNNNANENNIKTYKNINKNITKQKSSQIKNDIKNKSSNNISYKININNNKNYSPNRENIKINRSIDKYSSNKNDKSMKINNNIRNINISNAINQNISKSFKKNKSISKKKETSKKKNENIIMRNDSLNKEIQNINKRNKSVNNKNNCVNTLNNNTNDKNIKPNKSKNVVKENNCKNKRYENCMQEDDNLKIEEYSLSQNKNKNNIILMQREVKNMVIKSMNFVNNSTQGASSIISAKNNVKNLNDFHSTKSTKNINTFKNTYMNSPNNKVIGNDNQLYDKIIINNLNSKETKGFKISDITNFPPPDELLNECIINLNKANSLKNSSNSVTKNIQFSEEVQEKTIINDDIDEEEKNENNAYEDLFDDIDTEKDDFNDSNLINNQKKESQKILKENKKKYFEADDALEYNRNIEIEKEKLKEDKSESNTLNAKGSVKRKKRKINKNHFNKSRPYLTNNKKDLLSTNKLNIEELLNSQFQSGLKMSSNNNFMNKSKRVLPKELFNYSTRKSKDNIQNNIISSNYKIFKEKHKTNIYLKNNSDNACDINDLANYKTNPIVKHHSNAFIIPDDQFFPRNNKNVHNTNKKILLLKNDNYLNSLKDIDDFENKNNHNNNLLLENNCIIGAGTEKKMISLSNEENTNIFNDTGNKIKRPTSCVNRKLEKYYTKNEKHKNFIKFSNQGKKIYLKTNNKASQASIKIDDINNINFNYNTYTNKGIRKEQNKSNENENKENKNIFMHLNLHHPENILTDIFSSNNSGELSLKTSKGISFKYSNICSDKEAKQKRFLSAMNSKAIKRNNKNILL